MTRNELMHYGVLGMKWGVRKDGAPQGTEGWVTSAKRGWNNMRTSQENSENERIAAFNARRTAKAQQKVDKYSGKTGKRANKKLEKASKRLTEAKLREEYVNDRNKEATKRNSEYRMKTAKEKLADSRTWNALLLGNSVSNQNRWNAQKDMRSHMVSKYGEKTVKSVERKDTAKAIAAIAGMSAITTVITLAYINDQKARYWRF